MLKGTGVRNPEFGDLTVRREGEVEDDVNRWRAREHRAPEEDVAFIYGRRRHKRRRDSLLPAASFDRIRVMDTLVSGHESYTFIGKRI